MHNKTSKLILLSLIFTFPMVTLSQVGDLDESFLKSLPEEIRSDLLDQKSSKEKLEEAQYRRPSTFIKKPESSSERFGAQIFTMMQSTLMPLNEPNFDGTYTLDYGDVLEVQFIGQKSSISQLPIKRDGSINLPEIGKIFLSGLSLASASELIKSKVNVSYIGVEAFITLVNIRDIQIIVAGNVYNPGPYTLNGNSNIFHALSVSGGPSEIGSYRSINLVRNNEVIEEIDLYDTFILGNSSLNSRLRSGDTVFVKPLSNLVSIAGGVRRPGTYELKSSSNLMQAIEYANGLTNKADLSKITLYRLSEGKVVTLEIRNISELNSISPKDNDKLVIRKYPYRSVSINGAISSPGSYIINEGDGILELVQRAGGYTKTAYPFGGVLENQNTKKINEMAVSELYNAFLNSLTSNLTSSGEDGMGNILSVMEELRNSPVSGRVSAEFNLDTLQSDPLKDVSLQDGDKITIPEILDHVYIYGEVSSQGTVRYQEGEDFLHYINKKGGFGENADQKAVFILHPNGETIRVKRVSRNLFMSKAEADNLIYPGSVVFVPRKSSNALLATRTAQAYATILGNIGVSLASISVLKD
jgi:protein involved in polysaccharide export with SLBB domain